MRSEAQPQQQAVQQVRHYYEQNTRLFLAVSRARAKPAIHRAVWAAGVHTGKQALGYINQLILSTIEEHAISTGASRLQILDIGSGAGGTLLHLVQHLALPVEAMGISISPVQVQIANMLAASHGVAEHCRFLEANFMEIPASEAFDCAIAIEALIHAPDLRQALAQAASALKPGGLLMICDDFRTLPGRPADQHPCVGEWLADFRRGWQARGLTPRQAAIHMAQEAGLRLVVSRELTPDLRLLRLPEWIGNLVLRVGRLLPEDWAVIQGLMGGLALQYCLKHHAIGYQWFVFQKND